MIWPFYAYIDTVATILGFMINVMLLVAIVTRTSKTIQHYGNLLLVCTVIDLLYAVNLAVCHHHNQFRERHLIILSYGLEPYLPQWMQNILTVSEYYFLNQAYTIIPVQFYYRYYLTTSTDTNAEKKRVLAAAVGLSVLVTLSVPGIALYGHARAQERGAAKYIALLDPMFFDRHNQTAFVAAIDFADVGLWFTLWGCTLIGASYALAGFYGYRSFRGISLEHGAASPKLRLLRRQFLRNMVAQALVNYFLCTLPMSVVCGMMLLHMDTAVSSIIVMSVVNWAPFANGLASILIIRPYREFLLGRPRSVVIYRNSATQSTKVHTMS